MLRRLHKLQAKAAEERQQTLSARPFAHLNYEKKTTSDDLAMDEKSAGGLVRSKRRSLSCDTIPGKERLSAVLYNFYSFQSILYRKLQKDHVSSNPPGCFHVSL